jgi:hypothetical protein
LRGFSFPSAELVLPALLQAASPRQWAKVFRSPPQLEFQRLVPTFAFWGEALALPSGLSQVPKALAKPHLELALPVTRRTQYYYTG